MLALRGLLDTGLNTDFSWASASTPTPRSGGLDWGGLLTGGAALIDATGRLIRGTPTQRADGGGGGSSGDAALLLALQNRDQPKAMNYTPWILGGVAAVVALGGAVFLSRRRR